MPLPRITQQEMTEREQRELNTLLHLARYAHVRHLPTSEPTSTTNKHTPYYPKRDD
ncbi:DUF3811 domain-containing protein [Escherichia coli]